LGFCEPPPGEKVRPAATRNGKRRKLTQGEPKKALETVFVDQEGTGPPGILFRNEEPEKSQTKVNSEHDRPKGQCCRSRGEAVPVKGERVPWRGECRKNTDTRSKSHPAVDESETGGEQRVYFFPAGESRTGKP